MPELPEVETIRQDLRQLLLRKKISDVEIFLPRIIKSNIAIFKKILIGSQLDEIDRKGKLLIFRFDKKKNYLLIHLKMTGQLVYCSKNQFTAGGHSTKEAVNCDNNKYSRIIFHFSNGDKLLFNDMRTFGAIKLVDDHELKIELDKFGIEPLQKDFTLDKLKKIIHKRSLNIKALLLNQGLVSGIGNIYADEIMFHAGIMPNRIAKELSDEEIRKIFESTKIIIKNAIKNRGTTFNNYVDGKGRKGTYVKKLKVYGRGGQKCLKCTNDLKKIKLAGRGTVYCAICQK